MIYSSRSPLVIILGVIVSFVIVVAFFIFILYLFGVGILVGFVVLGVFSLYRLFFRKPNRALYEEYFTKRSSEGSKDPEEKPPLTIDHES